jgi:hypothetical protein
LANATPLRLGGTQRNLQAPHLEYLLPGAPGDLIWLVLVATVAGVFHIATRVACQAGNLTLLAMIQWKAVQAQQRWAPGLGSVAVLAIQTKEPGMNGWLSVAMDAGIWRTGEDLPRVTILAGDIGMFSIQGEDSFMVKS